MSVNIFNASTNELDPVAGGLTKTQREQLEDNGQKFRFGYLDGKFGYYTSDERGADSFSPFSSGLALLWEAPFNKSVAGFTLNLDIDDYDGLLIGTHLYLHSTSSPIRPTYSYIKKGTSGVIGSQISVADAASSTKQYGSRNISVSEDGAITISTGSWHNSSGVLGDNRAAIPFAIYGVKETLIGF